MPIDITYIAYFSPYGFLRKLNLNHIIDSCSSIGCYAMRTAGLRGDLPMGLVFVMGVNSTPQPTVFVLNAFVCGYTRSLSSPAPHSTQLLSTSAMASGCSTHCSPSPTALSAALLPTSIHFMPLLLRGADPRKHPVPNIHERADVHLKASDQRTLYYQIQLQIVRQHNLSDTAFFSNSCLLCFLVFQGYVASQHSHLWVCSI